MLEGRVGMEKEATLVWWWGRVGIVVQEAVAVGEIAGLTAGRAALGGKRGSGGWRSSLQTPTSMLPT